MLSNLRDSVQNELYLLQPPGKEFDMGNGRAGSEDSREHRPRYSQVGVFMDHQGSNQGKV
jgi:hypothetical protein